MTETAPDSKIDIDLGSNVFPMLKLFGLLESMASTIPDVYGVDVRGLDFAAAVAPVFASRADMVVAYSHRLPFKRARVESFELVDKAIALCREKTDSVIPPDLFTTPPELAQLRPYLAAFVLGSTLSRCLLQSSVEGVDWDEKITSIGLAEILHSTDCKEPDKEGDGDSQPQEASDQTARLLLLRELSCLVSKAQFAFTAPLLKCCHNPQCSFEGLRTPGVHDQVSQLLCHESVELFYALLSYGSAVVPVLRSPQASAGEAVPF
mmetsp:Transcript_27854/g.54634  ORF Transcript_27854/g.54634 Transcript_27854/m.54634 type:complete len:264 (-) Transcript_27854:223-1014(-)